MQTLSKIKEWDAGGAFTMYEKVFYELRPYLYGAFGFYTMMKFTHSHLNYIFSGILIAVAFVVIRRRLQGRGVIE